MKSVVMNSSYIEYHQMNNVSYVSYIGMINVVLTTRVVYPTLNVKLALFATY